MKNIKNSYLMTLASIILVFAFLILISAVASAAQETRLSWDTGENGEPSIYGDKVVWSYWYKIHLYDLKTGNDTTISAPANYIPFNAAIYGNKIVWTLVKENSNDVPSLCVYDIPTSSSSLITENVSSWTKPAIYGDRIVWSAGKNGINIYMYDLSTHKGTQITTSGHARNPDIYGDIIVWEDNGRNGTAIDKNNNIISKSDIYMYDLSTKNETRITTSGFALNPTIYSDRIVWHDSRNSDFIRGIGDVYMYNLSTEKESWISYSGQSSLGSSPAIYGDRIVWQDRRNGNSDIYMYDLLTQKETQITTSGYAMDPDIYGNIIVDKDNRAGSPSGDGYLCDIYMYDLTVKPIESQAGFTSNVTSGTAPLTVLFTDSRTEGVPTSWLWDFSDGVNSKNAINATHTFTKPGVYNVTLTVANEAGSSTVTKPNYITVTSSQAPVADFFSPQVDKARGNLDSVKNEALSFIDNSIGSPTSWLWDFGDGTISTAQNPTHAYTTEGGYTVTLAVKNAIGSNTVSKYGYALVKMDEGGIIAPAYFSSNVTSGIAPLTVLFHDTTFPDANGDYAYGRYWDFGDRTNYGDDYDENNSTYITHTYKKPGKYTVTLRSYDIGGGCIITKYNCINVTDPNAPVADFNINITQGYAPLTVQFNDISQKATSRIWDFNGDGQPDSSDINPVYAYANPGTYTVNLTVDNENGTASKTTALNVLTPSSSSGDRSGGSSHSSGGAGGSPEPAKNVKVKELCQVFITSGKPVKFDFTKNSTSIAYLSFDSKKTVGKTTTIVEMLKNKSALTTEAPEGEVYHYINIWVGNGGYGSNEDNLKNAVVCFRVEKSWVQDKSIDQSSITLNRYSDKKWNELPTAMLREDDKYLYLTADAPGFSSFAITGTEEPSSEETVTKTEIDCFETINKNNTRNKEPQNEQKEILSTPSFEIYYGVAGLLAVLLYKRK